MCDCLNGCVEWLKMSWSRRLNLSQINPTTHDVHYVAYKYVQSYLLISISHVQSYFAICWNVIFRWLYMVLMPFGWAEAISRWRGQDCYGKTWSDMCKDINTSSSQSGWVKWFQVSGTRRLSRIWNFPTYPTIRLCKLLITWWHHHVSAPSFEHIYLLLLLYNIYLSHTYILYSNKSMHILDPLNELHQSSLVSMQS